MLWRKVLATSRAPISIVAGANQQTDPGDTITITTPVGSASGDLLISIVANNEARTWTTGSGFTEVKDTNGVEVSRQALSGAPSANYTFTASGGVKKSGVMIALRRGTYGLIGAADTSGAISAPSINMAKGGILLAVVVNYSTGHTFTAPTGMTAVSGAAVTSGVASIAVFSEEVAAGATGNRAFAEAADYGILIGIYGAN